MSEKNQIKQFFARIFGKMIEKKWYLPLFVAVFFAVYYFLDVTLAVFLLIFSVFLVYGWSYAVILAGAGVSLGGCVLFMFLKIYNFAEILAIYIFYFILIALFLKINYLWRQPERPQPPANLPFNPWAADIFKPVSLNLPKPARPERAVWLTAVNVFIVVLYLLIFGAQKFSSGALLTLGIFVAGLLILNAFYFLFIKHILKK